ncbi:MAG: sigma-70 family RNA polymerase sigma factor [Oscillospiraceae bacterium]|jgi:RNA polymerase sigma-70 factor (ECF subfamily)|nr:sigma-70 family RNA polymerase sigma factor [Oscillospiraceae bacterium]
MGREEFAESVRKYRDTVFRVALGYVKNVYDADDIAQNVFFKMYKKQKSFVTEEAEKAWLIRVAINESKDLLKSAWKKNASDLDESVAAPSNGDTGLIDYVKGLKPKYRTVIYLFYYERYSSKEIARILKMPQSTVTTQLNRAREQLREIITKEENRYGEALQRNV